jgi:hypothetical protein
MQNYPVSWFLTLLVICLGWLAIIVGAFYSFNIPGRDVTALRLLTFGGFAAGGIIFWMIGALARVFLNWAQLAENELLALAQERTERRVATPTPLDLYAARRADPTR